ncbi:MAG: SRPBCC domain-containing protein [Bacteroidetes bacterium]|nr:SRPBCC domain-containing protein [Bacteroidota bacterium]
MSNKIEIVKDLPNKKITVTRLFDAEVELVWRAWTEADLLDLWWAPKPWKAETKSMTFKEGGFWLYAMVGPDGTKHWSKINYTKISPHHSIETTDCFCDENGVMNPALPSMSWKNVFTGNAKGTTVVVEISFAKEADINTIIEMGFEAGFTSALGNLEQYLQAKFKLRNQLKQTTMARTTTYLNFPGNTEEAFNFYKSVFGTEFSGKGMQRFGDIPNDAGHPPVAENIKKMILHVELPLLGGHVLMATDAPKEMGFELIQGNNMHICLEPETKAETKRLFEALTSGGNIIMPLQDMFFGSYFGQCTDRFGINWMFNCTEK